MCGIQNVIRKDGIYYYRRLIRIGSDTPFRLRLSLKTASRRQAALMAPALTIHCAHLVMRLMEKANQDGLTEQQRAEIFRQQILIERDRLEVMHAKLHIIPPEEQDDIEQALTVPTISFSLNLIEPSLNQPPSPPLIGGSMVRGMRICPSSPSIHNCT